MTFEYKIYHTELGEALRTGTIEAPSPEAVKGLIIAQENGTSDEVRRLVTQNIIKIYVKELTEV